MRRLRRPAAGTLILLSLTAAAACAPTGREATTAPAPAPAPGDVGTAGLAALVDSIAGTPPLHRARWGVEVVDGDGAVLLRRDADRLFSAASNAKLATVAAALELLGPTFRWTTAVEARGLSGGVAEALVVRGSGDPTLSRSFHDDPLAALDSLAAELARGGVRRVSGPVVMDVSRFDSVLAHPAWEAFDLDWYYAAPVAPFAVMEGAYPVVMTPAAAGEPARVELLVPSGLVAMDARVMTVPGARRWNDDLRRVAGSDSVVFRGEIGVGAPADTSWIAQDEPARLAGRALVRALEMHGIDVAGPVVVTSAPDLAPGAAGPAGARATWRSPPLSDIVPLSLEESDNWVTEQLLKTLGAELDEVGSWSAGTRVVETFLEERVGIDAGAMYLRDGSGLTSQTLLTPHALVTLLRYAATRPWGPLFRDAMASPGETRSTLDDRLLHYGDRLAAKTGTLAHVVTLSGYAVARDGGVRVFSILTNGSGRPSSEARAAIDRIVEAIIENGSW